MPTIDLTSITPAPSSRGGDALAAAPRRIGLNLAELQYAARLAGDAPLPFEVAAPPTADAMQARLGQSPATLDDQAFRAAVAALHDPADALERRGLTVDGVPDAGLAGAIGLLASPRFALDVDVAMGGVQAKVWHRQGGGAVASLATVDGIVFELGWFGSDAWAAELARVAAISEEVVLGPTDVPAYVDLPYELADAAAEAGGSGRGDLLPVLAARHRGAVRGPDGPLDDASVVGLLAALASEARGRLRALVADVSGAEVDTVGVVSWTLLADGWRALRPHHDDGVLRLELRAVAPDELGAVVAPVLGEAAR
ncbi:hypothetical protein [Nocardioides nitrophenolicus]|uniref:hypothetical protein n=1 Tax=Nocardioides nitrophenolicus TaxID=60489 RepID=UPI001956E5D7|nr:hypothetical protein [Nocardioides nitrophenolicus]MBM7516919.1 hypothetical protein [Nocardioides nitrophenolicus]